MAFLQRNDQQIVKAGAGIRTHAHDVRIDDLDQRADHFACRDTEKLVLLRRFAHNRSGVVRVSAPRHFSNVEYGKLGRFRVMSKVIAKWSLEFSLPRRNDTFQYEFRI